MTPLYELEYTGDLYFEIFEKNKDNNVKESWGLLHTIEINNSDNIVSKLVDLLHKLRDDAISKKAIIDKEKIKKDEERKKQIKKWEEDRIREEQAKIDKEELLKKQKTEQKIRSHLDKWEYINKTLLYVNELRSISDASDEEKELILKYCDYVEKFYNKSEFYKEITGFYKELEGREEIK